MLPLQGDMLTQILFKFPPQNFLICLHGNPDLWPEKKQVPPLKLFIFPDGPGKEDGAPKDAVGCFFITHFVTDFTQ